jgi:hypothetical protein
VSAVSEETARRDGGLNVYAELWSSFISLIRSYTAAHGLNREEQAILEVSGDEMLVRVGPRWLRIRRTGSDGQWDRENGQRMRFQFDEEGRIVVHGHAEEMDVVAEKLAREVML